MQVRAFSREPAVWVDIVTISTAVLAAVVTILALPFVVSAPTGAVGTVPTAVGGSGCTSQRRRSARP